LSLNLLLQRLFFPELCRRLVSRLLCILQLGHQKLLGIARIASKLLYLTRVLSLDDFPFALHRLDPKFHLIQLLLALVVFLLQREFQVLLHALHLSIGLINSLILS